VRYVSTRGQAPTLEFPDVLLAGLARDGGLYVPETWPSFSDAEMRALAGLPYADIAVAIMRRFVGDTISQSDLIQMCRTAYDGFDHPAVAPLRQIGPNDFLLELFHGPTLAFKDYALQVVGLLFDHVLKERGQRITIVGATSGDTGSAAIEACRDRETIDIFILHPAGRTSEVQRRQMTTVTSSNVHNVAIEGTFDDCQDLVKAMFNDMAFRDSLSLSAVNSINWARILGQIAYYAAACVALGAPDRRISFSVPTGNFGNVFAGYGAKKLGFPIERLVVGSNKNDILTRFFASNDMSLRPVDPSLSPSMDIGVSSNFERLLFELADRDGAAVAETMTTFRETGKMAISDNLWQVAREGFDGARFDDDETLSIIKKTRGDTAELLCPHSAIGVAAAQARRGDQSVPMVTLATAHPAKFPDAVERATGIRPSLPPRLSDLYTRQERFETLPNDLTTVQAFVRNNTRAVMEDVD